MGGSASSVVSAVTSPYTFVAEQGYKAATGNDLNLSPGGIAADQLYDKPKEAKADIEKMIKEQEDAARQADEEYKKEASDEKKKARDIALQNLQRSQARLASLQTTKAGGYGGTILTSPLGIPSDNSTAPGQKTLLGY